MRTTVTKLVVISVKILVRIVRIFKYQHQDQQQNQDHHQVNIQICIICIEKDNYNIKDQRVGIRRKY